MDIFENREPGDEGNGQAMEQLRRRNEELENRLQACTTEIETLRQREQTAHAKQQELLRQVAAPVPLQQILDVLVESIEAQTDGLRGSIMLLDEDGVTLRVGSAPHLPQAYLRQIDGWPIGPDSGPCGITCQRKERVVVADIANSTTSPGFRRIALEHGLLACWTQPITNREGRVLGTFALYYTAPREPDAAELTLVGAAVRLAELLIEQRRAEEALRFSEQRFHDLIGLSSDSYWEQDAELRFTAYTSSSGKMPQPLVTGMIGKRRWELPVQGVSDAEWQSHRRLLEARQPFEITYQVQHPGSDPRWIFARGQPVFSESGTFLGYRGIGRDITQSRLAADALRENEQRLQRLFGQAAVGIAEGTLSGRYLRVNNKTCEILGRTEEEIIGHSFREFTHPDDIDTDIAGYKPIFADETDFFQREKRYLRKDGSVVWVNALGALVRDDSGQAKYIVATIEDITERKAAQEALHKQAEILRITLENMGQGITLMDDNLRLLAYNRQFLSLLQLPDSLVAGEPTLEDFLRFNAQRGEYGPGDAETQVRERMDLAKLHLPHRLERKRPDGTVLEMVGNTMPNGWLVTIYTDITERKKNEYAIQDMNAQLERRVRERTAALEASNRELEAFSYSVSHDLRAPLRAIDGFSHLLREDYATSLDEEGHVYLSRIRLATQRMGNLIDEMINLACISRAELNKSACDLSEIARSVISDLQAGANERDITWTIDPMLPAQADPALIRVVLQSLLDNAMKFTRLCEGVRIGIGRTEKNGEVAFFVRDNGAGFDMAYAAKLFQPFERLHAVTEYGGAGIGLAIVQRVIQRHGGRVWAEGAPDQGAVFYFTLP